MRGSLQVIFEKANEQESIIAAKREIIITITSISIILRNLSLKEMSLSKQVHRDTTHMTHLLG